MKNKYFQEKECDSEFHPLRNYLYDQSKINHTEYKNIQELYKHITTEASNSKLLLIDELRIANPIYGFSFTFQDQVQKCKHIIF